MQILEYLQHLGHLRKLLSRGGITVAEPLLDVDDFRLKTGKIVSPYFLDHRAQGPERGDQFALDFNGGGFQGMKN